MTVVAVVYHIYDITKLLYMLDLLKLVEEAQYFGFRTRELCYLRMNYRFEKIT